MIDTLNNYYNKERKYNKVSKESIKASSRNKSGKTKFAKGDEGLTWQQRVKKSAMKASDNGRCWWVHDYIIRTTINTVKREPLATHTGLAQELYPKVSHK